MKRIIALLLAIMMTIALTACGGASSADQAASDNQASNTSSDAENASDSTDNSDMVVGFIYTGPIGDGGYTYSHDQGRLYLENELGVKTIYKESVPETQEVEQEIRNMIDQGAKVIFSTSFGFMEFTKKMALEYPDVTFFHCSGYETTDNMSNYFGRIYQPRYLSGIVAGMKTKSNEIGYVAAFAIPECIRGINAFTLGVQSVNPDAKVKVVWTNTWYDPAKEKDAAIALLDDGADVIAQHQDTTGPQQAAEERGAYSIGYNTDMYEMAPGSYMTAPVWHWGPYYVEQVKAVMNGTYQSDSYWGGMDEDVVELAPLTENAPEGAQEAVDAAKAKILDGSNQIFTGPLYDQEGNLKLEEGQTLADDEILNMNWFVQGVDGKIE